VSISKGDGLGSEGLTPSLAPLTFGKLDLPAKVRDWTYASGLWVQDNNAPCHRGHLDATLLTEEKDVPHQVAYQYSLPPGAGTVGFRCYLKSLGEDRILFVSVGGERLFAFKLKPEPEIVIGTGTIVPLRYGWYICRTSINTGTGNLATVGVMERRLRRVYPGDPKKGFYLAHARIDWACR
jgi:hypothetical protein